ncbi:MAG: hypothetical protein JJW01_00185 [Alphaproteobacteria bacterium]|nr:hypothetical protein [Rickettsiales bacterium]
MKYKNFLHCVIYYTVISCCIVATEGKAKNTDKNKTDQSRRYRIVNNNGKPARLTIRIPEYNLTMLGNDKNSDNSQYRQQINANNNAQQNNLNHDSVNKRQIPQTQQGYTGVNNNRLNTSNSASANNQSLDGQTVVYRREQNKLNNTKRTLSPTSVSAKPKNKNINNEVQKKNNLINVTFPEEQGTEYYIEIDSFKKKGRALKLSKEINEKLKILLEPQKNNRTEYSVSIGPLFSKHDAIIMKEEMQNYGYNNAKIILAK